MSADSKELSAQIDLSDLDRLVGKEVVFAELWDPCNATDIRRWAMAMDNPSPIHWDEEFANVSKFGGIIAPQSFAVAMDYGHGCHPAGVGKIPGSHLIFGGEEWWYFGTPIRPGDKLFQKRRFDGYDLKETAFAGPTVFQRGDTEHRNQHGALVARERATSIRYLREEANKRAVHGKERAEPRRWTKDELKEIHKLRHEWLMSNREGHSPAYGDVQVGDKLPRRVIGPHSVVTFVTEYRAFRQNVWGTWRWNVPEGKYDPAMEDAGFAEDMTYDHEAKKVDPRMGDGLYFGPSSGHVNLEKADKIGLGGMYGYGASMNAWHVDYVAYWAGHDGYIWHSKTQFRNPAFEGDITYIDGEVIEKSDRSAFGCPIATVQVTMTTQEGEVILKGTADVELPH